VLLRARIAPPERRPLLQRLTPYAMDIERINSIGTLLADLAARTQQLRGYL
jgi:hypothetical protein